MINRVSPFRFAKSGHRKQLAFTLVELLVVMAIIAALMGLLFPVASSVMRSAKKTQATTDAQSVKSAINAYYTEYGRFPVDTSTSTTDDMELTSDAELGDLYKVLIASPKDDTLVQEMNPRLISFLDVKDAKPAGQTAAEGPRGGLSSDYVFMDPWGQPYTLVIDANYNDELTSLPAPFADPEDDRPLRDTVAVASPGDPNDPKAAELRAISTWR